MKKITYEKLLKSFLNVYFLRPENAIFCANLAHSIHQSLNINKSDKIAEIATGDGVFSFLTFGGEFNKSFEVNGAMHENDSAHLWVLERKF